MNNQEKTKEEIRENAEELSVEESTADGCLTLLYNIILQESFIQANHGLFFCQFFCKYYVRFCTLCDIIRLYYKAGGISHVYLTYRKFR